MNRAFSFGLLRASGLILFLGLNVQASDYIEQLSGNLNDWADELSLTSLQESSTEAQATFRHRLSTSAGGDEGFASYESPGYVTLQSYESYHSSTADGFTDLSCGETSYCGSSCCASTCDSCASCSTGCCDGFSSGCGGCCDEPKTFLGCLQSTPSGWSNFVSPITNPVFFEDPRTLTEARFIYLNHTLPHQLGGRTVELVAVQVRAAITDRLSVIATKDGFIMSESPLIDDGWADVAAGLKYNLYKDVCSQQILSAGMTFELPVGTPRAWQGNGDGEFNVFLSGGAEVADGMHFISASGFRLPTDTSSESQVWYWSNHLDAQIVKGVYLLGEVNWYHWMKSGDNGVPGVEGGDLFNLGSTGVAGNDIVTAALGVKLKPAENQEIGFAWEVPLTDRRDVLDDRYTIDWIIRF